MPTFIHFSSGPLIKYNFNKIASKVLLDYVKFFILRLWQMALNVSLTTILLIGFYDLNLI